MIPMIGRRLALYLTALSTLTGGLTLTGAAAAGGADGFRVDAKPERVVVDRANEGVRWSVSNPRGCLEDASVTIEHARSHTRAYTTYDTWARDGLSGSLNLYDVSRTGRYRVFGEGWNNCVGKLGAYSSFTPDFIMVKRAARVALTSRRHQRRVNLTARVRKYSGGHRAWTAHSGVRVVFQRKTARGWQRVVVHRADRRGVAAVAFRSADRARYRARVSPTAGVWGDASRGVLR